MEKVSYLRTGVAVEKAIELLRENNPKSFTLIIYNPICGKEDDIGIEIVSGVDASMIQIKNMLGEIEIMKEDLLAHWRRRTTVEDIPEK